MKRLASLLLATSLSAIALPGVAASISFTEIAGGNVVVTRDNFDWDPNQFTVNAGPATATVDANNILRFSNQGQPDNTQIMAIEQMGVITDVLVATWRLTSPSRYDVDWSFFSGAAIPGTLNLAGALVQQRGANGVNTFGLSTFSLSQSIRTLPANVSEPGSVALFGLSLLALGALRRRSSA